MTPDDTTALHDLAAAYALDALSPDEAQAFEAHLATCSSCTDEVAALQGVAAGLAGLAVATPPPELRSSVLDAIADIAQVAPAPDEQADDVERVVSIRPDATGTTPAGPTGLPDESARPPDDASARPADVVSLAEHRRVRATSRIMTGVAAALVLVVGGLGLWANDLNGQVGDLDEQVTALGGELEVREQTAQQVASVLNAPDAELTNVDGSSLVRSPSAGQAVFAAGSLEDPGSDQVLQLWVIDDQGATSAGLVADPDTPTLLDIPVPEGTVVGVTVEPAGGSDQPTSDPVVTFDT